MAKLSMGIKLFAIGLAIFSVLPVQHASALSETIRQFGTDSYDDAHSIAYDSTGVYVIGQTFGNLPGYTNAGGIDVFVRKYSSQGNVLWTRQFGTVNFDVGYSVVTHDNSVYVAGNFEPNGFIRKYDQSGNELWTQTYSYGDGLTYITDIAFDGGSMYFSAITGGTAPGEINYGGNYDAILQKNDLSGNVTWARQIGSNEADYANSIVANNNLVTIGGLTYGSLPGHAYAGGLGDAFAAQYDSSGNLGWTRQFGTNEDDFVYDISEDGVSIYLAGGTKGIIGTQPNFGDNDAFVKKISQAGSDIWTQQLGTSGSEIAYGVTNRSGKVYIGSNQGSDAMLRVLDTNTGSTLKTHRYQVTPGTGNGAWVQAVVVTDTEIFGAGSVYGNFPGQTGNDMDDAFFVRQPLDTTPLPPVVCNLLPILCN